MSEDTPRASLRTTLGRASLTCVLAIVVVHSGCDAEPAASPYPRELAPADTDVPADLPPMPPRDKPRAIVEAEGKLFVALGGTEMRPGRELAVLDAASLTVLDRIEVGSMPHALAVHPSGRFVAVACRFASYVAIVDARPARVVAEIPAPFYVEDLAFSPDGTRAALTNRWKRSVIRWEVDVDDERFVARVIDAPRDAEERVGIALPGAPRRVRFLDDARVLVTSESDLALYRVDLDTREVLERRVGSPVLDLAVVGPWVVIAHTGTGTGHPPDDGFDGDEDGARGDGTANVGFQDLQNEVAVLRASDLEVAQAYTSDSICCRDYRDVDPDRPEHGAGLAPVDRWPASRVDFLPPRDRWIVGGALPERLLAHEHAGVTRLAVVYGGSSELQLLDVDLATGALVPRGLRATGRGAMDVIHQPTHARYVVVDRLDETLSVIGAFDGIDPEPGAPRETIVVGDVSVGAFPASDAEIGELVNTVGAAFGVDGDQTCVHCHRDGSPIGKPVSMPLLAQPEWGVRNVMAYRGAHDSAPWFLEAAMNEDNFFPVLNEFARRENFCCEQSDPRVWASYPTRDACLASPDTEGCVHVLDCEASPPPECATRGYGSPHLTRDAHFRAAARALFERDESFGDALFVERLGADGTIVRRPIPLGFDGVTRALGVFLRSDPRLLPNPVAAVSSARARVGEALFRSPRTGCSTCHPLPVGATVDGEGAPISFSYVVSPLLHPDTGEDVDRVSDGFLGTFPRARQTVAGVRFGATNLRGVWDRSRLLHHGAARSLREVLATPGHPALRPGERGLNERFGQPDTHGATSTLSVDELLALERFLEGL